MNRSATNEILQKAEIKRAAHDLSGAISLCLEAGNDPDVLVLLSELYQEDGNNPLAMQVINTLLTDSPFHARAHAQKANVFAAMGQNGLAVALYDKALKLCEETDLSGKNVITNNKAKALTAEEKYDEAIDLYETIIKSSPAFVFAYTGIAVVYYQQQQFNKAIPYLENALAIDPQHALTWELLSQILAMENQFEKALYAAEKAIGLEPYKAENYFRRGIILHQLSQPEEGCESLRKASKMGYPLADKAIATYCS